MGIEPTPSAWEAEVLPLYYTRRKRGDNYDKSTSDKLAILVRIWFSQKAEFRYMTLQYPARPLRSYVLRQGRMTPGQKLANQELWPLYGLEIPALPQYYDWESVFGRQAPCVLEIGFGMGGSLVELARQHPDVNFIGVEVHPPGVGRCLHQIHEYQLSNLKIFRGDAKAVLDNAIAPNSLDKVLLLFPDPWPKTRHQKRRIVQMDFANTIAGKLKTEGFFHLATDWESYADHMLATLDACPALKNHFGQGQFSPDTFGRVKTKYQQRGESRGHLIWDLVYQKNT